jgi:hypothetical protein
MGNVHKKLVLVLASSVLTLDLGIHATPALAATFTTDVTTFLNTNQIVSTTTFDDLIGATFPGSSVTIDLVTYNTETSIWGVRSGGAGRGFTGLFPPSRNELQDLLSFGSNQSVKAIGLDLALIFSILRPIPLPEFNFIVEEIDGTLTTFSSTLQNGFGGFFGFSSEVGIKTLTILQPPDQPTRTGWAYNTVYRSAVTESVVQSVPEPTSVMGLVVISALGVSNALVRKQKQKSAFSPKNNVL